MSETEKTERLFDELWPTRPPPADFAARVLAATNARPAATVPARPSLRTRRRWPVLAATAALAATVLLWWWGSGTGESARGQLRAQQRQTVNIGSRALAVLEAGAEISWSRQDGRFRVDQPRGVVFYRVDSGKAFLVVTPAGEIEVTGTCFRVSVEPADGRGRPSLAAAVVEVMEGAVKLRNSDGQLALAAGERGQIAPGRRPERQADGSAAQRALALAQSAGTFPRLQPADPGSTPSPAVSGDDDPAGPPGDKYFDFTPEERLALARRCNFRWALPRHLTHFVGTSFSDLAIGSESRAAVIRALEEHRDSFMQQMRGIYLEVVGDKQAVQTLSAMGLFQEIDAKSLRAEGREARLLILREWAGAPAPSPSEVATRAPLERMWRLLVGAQDELVRRLERIVGPADARRVGEALLDVQMDGSEGRCPTRAPRPPPR